MAEHAPDPLARSAWPTPRSVLERGCVALVAAVPLVVVPQANEAFELPKLVAFRAILLAALLGAGFAAWRRRADHAPLQPASTVARVLAPQAVRGTIRWPPLWAALAVLATWSLSAFASESPTIAWWGSYQRWTGVYTQAAFLGLFLVAATAFSHSQGLQRLALGTATVASIVSLYAVLQRFGWDPVRWTSGVVRGWEAVSASDRPFATLGNPSFLAAYLTLSLPLTLGATFAAPPRLRALWWLATLLQALALLFTQSRSGWLGMGAGVLIFGLILLWGRRVGPRLVLAAGAVLVALAAATLVVGQGALPREGLLARAFSIFDPTQGSASLRLLLWDATLQLSLVRPLLGFGPDLLGSVIARRYPPELWRLETPQFVVDRAHNASLDTLVSVGILGSAALLALGLVVATAAWRLLRVRENGLHVPLLVGALAALAAHVVEQQFNVAVTAASLLAWLLAGAIVGLAWPPGRKLARTPRLPSEEGLGSVGEPPPLTAPRHAKPPGRASRRAAGASLLVPRAHTVRWRTTVAVATLLVAGTIVVWQVQPLRADVFYAQGLAMQRAGRFADARSSLAQAVAVWPHEPAYWNELARAHLQLARSTPAAASGPAYASAVEAAEQALRLDPSNTLLWSTWGLIAGETAARTADSRLAERARQAHARATGQAPNYWLYWRSAGATEFNLRSYAAAQQAFARAIALFDNDQPTWSALGDAAAMAGDVSTARRAYERALRMNDTDAHVRQALERLPNQ